MRKETIKHLGLTYGPLLAALALEFAIFEYLGRRQGIPWFVSTDILMLILNQSVVYGIMVVGMTFVIITGGIDLAVGSLLACAGVAAAMVVQWGGEPVWAYNALGGVAALLLGAGVGAIAGFLITAFGIPPFIATLALMSALRGLGNLATDGKPISPLPPEYTFVGRYQLGGL
ncbi:MAG: hypothetical protein HYV26_20130, partial [Candidatus Hydrogenedentes bacterium]|nr:hypothetical protein [Candidatus Hydrogenedentota bacterium]